MLENCDWNFVFSLIGGLGGAVGVYLFFRSGIERMIQRQTDLLHKDIMSVKDDVKGIKDDIKEMREDSRRANERIDMLYKMFVDLLTGKTSDKPKTDP